MQKSKLDATRFSLIVAHDQDLGIGKNNQLPWRIPQDLKHFREVTSSVSHADLKNAIVMGRRTWESIPAKQRPLPKRQNIILTRNDASGFAELDVLIAKTLEDAIVKAQQLQCESCFVIGGAEVYRQALSLPDFRRLYTTEIMGTFDCDVFFPKYSSLFSLVEQSDWLHDESKTFRFCTYERN
jgi:dihydrofolate reductase / thymidylate synthase